MDCNSHKRMWWCDKCGVEWAWQQIWLATTLAPLNVQAQEAQAWKLSSETVKLSSREATAATACGKAGFSFQRTHPNTTDEVAK